MRLARPLLKLITVLAIVAAAFGGAVPSPARSSSARRGRRRVRRLVEAASEHAGPPERSTAAERRYVLDLNDLCDRTEDAFADLRGDQAGKVRAQRLRSWRQVFVRFDREFLALTPPKRNRLEAATVARLNRATLALTDGAIAALRAKDEEGYEAKVEAAKIIDARFDETMRSLGVPSCT